MLDLGIEFKDDFILCNDSSTSIFYPSKIRALEIIDEEDKIYTINLILITEENQEYILYMIMKVNWFMWVKVQLV